MKKKYAIMIVVALIGWTNGLAQEVSFCSKEFEMGVKIHLGLDDSASVSENQTDTITCIDLSGFGIKDVRDVLWLHNIKKLDLSNNNIKDITPLAMLDSLHILDISTNVIEDLCPLLFSHADSMVIHMSENFITDFSPFFRPTHCLFTLQGMSEQRVKDAPYFHVYQMYVDNTGKDTAELAYQAYTNIDTPFYVQCGNQQTKVQIDGIFSNVPISASATETTPILLTDGNQYTETTYLVPPKSSPVSAGETLVIETTLPSDYSIGYVKALHSECSAEGSSLKYVAPSPAVADTVYYCYYHNGNLRGLSQTYINVSASGIKEETIDKNLKLFLDNHWLHVQCNSPELSETAVIEVYDTLGKQLVSKEVSALHGIDETLFVRHNRGAILIVQIASGRKKMVEKLITK